MNVEEMSISEDIREEELISRYISVKNCNIQKIF